MNKFWKHGTMVFTLGCIYLLFEIISRWVGGAMVGYRIADMVHTKASLSGWTSLWMIPIGGACGYLLGWMNEWKWSKRLPLLIQALLGVILFIWPIELCSGLLVNKVFALGVWDYSADALNVLGQIKLGSLPGFMFVAVFAFWFDDVLRHWNLGEIRPEPMWTYYKRLILLRR